MSEIDCGDKGGPEGAADNSAAEVVRASVAAIFHEERLGFLLERQRSGPARSDPIHSPGRTA